MYGIYGRFLDVDLSTNLTGEYKMSKENLQLYLGGKGLAARILLSELTGKEHPLSPENILVFAIGPLQGTGVVGAGRHVVMGLSPKTGSVCDSYAGGYFGDEIGRSGYDGIIIRGSATEPVYLSLIEGKAAICSAKDLWGQGTGDTEKELKKRYPGGRVTSIGIAGEKLVLMACLINDRCRSAARPGFGAVMGSKYLKAIIIRGGTEKPINNPGRLKKERPAYAKTFLAQDIEQGLGKYGTARLAPKFSEMGILPTKNFWEGVFDQAEAVGGERMHDTILVGRETCTGCPIRCKRQVKTTFAGREVLPEYGGPEYETVAALGSLCLNDNLNAIALANQLCNDYGIDTISAGVAAAFLMEASEKGLIEEGLSWGDGEGIVHLIDRIARREGIGERIAAGLDTFAKELGADFAMTIKGMEIPMHECRGKQGLGISYATSPRGANHMEGMHDTMLEIDTPTPELGINRAYDRFTLTDKPGVVKVYEDLQSFTNSLILCCFTAHTVGNTYNYPEIRSLLACITGIEISPQEMLQVGERNYALMRLHAARAGYTMEKDGLPKRFNEVLKSGGSAGYRIAEDEMRAAIRAYYSERGYDQFGPTDETLRRLGMEDCIGEIRR